MYFSKLSCIPCCRMKGFAHLIAKSMRTHDRHTRTNVFPELYAVGRVELYTRSLYAVALQFPLSETKGPKPVPARKCAQSEYMLLQGCTSRRTEAA